MRALIFVAIASLCIVALASLYADPDYSGEEDDYDAAVAQFVTELSTLADPPPVRGENYVRELLIVDQTLRMLENSSHRKRYTIAFPIYKDGLHDMFVATAEELADETTAQHVRDELQLRAAQAREAIALRK